MFNKNKSLVRKIIDAVKDKLPEQDIQGAYELVEYNEWGEAFFAICSQLYEYDVSVSVEIFELITFVGNRMKMDSKLWDVLNVEST